MQLRSQPGHRDGVGFRRTACAFTLVVVAITSTACNAEQGNSPQFPAKYEDPETGAARLMADATPRIVGIVDVTNAYPDPGENIVGAAVLLDRSIGNDAARSDFHKRPVFVAYTDPAAAKRAVHGLKPGTYLRMYTHVIYLPANFPQTALTTYERGMGAGLH